MYLGEIIKQYRLEHGISQQTFADKCGLSKPYISQLENNYNPKTQEPVAPSSDTFIKVAKAMGISLKDLLEDVDQNQPVALKGIGDSIPAPSYEAAAGEGRIGDGYPTGEANLRVDEDQVIVTVRGRSMEPTLMDGDLVVVEATSVADSPTRIYLVKVNGEEHTLKHVVMNEDGLTLTADNMSVFPPRLYTAQQVKDLPVTIEGVVVKLVREME